MKFAQPGILESVPAHGRYLFLSPTAGATPAAVGAALQQLAASVDGQSVVVGIGPTLAHTLGADIPGLRTMPDFSGHGVQVPSTPVALWCWVRGAAQGEVVLHARRVEKALAPAFHLDRVLDGFRHGDPAAAHDRDLIGFEDGTENPEGDEAEAAALVHDAPEGMAGSSFVAIQQWVHNLDAFDALGTQGQDNAMGRRMSDNEELEDAPASAHVKRTAQESFSPEAFVLRRSLPWAVGHQCGLFFVAFGATLNAFEAQMRRMAGQEDGIVDATFTYSKPVTGAYLWCPPVRGGQLDLRQLGL
ncbi:Dyp-type peroxidase [Rhodoferax sp.]|uniref:Dyp-type peroxidase n=1 Tax=Rhodoferax sp. TaxID=50421 RepID=UPI0025CB9C00|nr:Dyp-type peroxidase [Rhodoferax sp.]